MVKNKITSSLSTIERLPTFMRGMVKNFAFRKSVPFVGTAGISFDLTTPNKWVLSIDNKHKVRNHLRQVHAGATLLLAETASVMIMAMNLPADRIPLVKRIEADFVRRSTGALTAVAILTDEQILFISNNPKGELVVEVDITDELHAKPILVQVTTAWTSKT